MHIAISRTPTYYKYGITFHLSFHQQQHYNGLVVITAILNDSKIEPLLIPQCIGHFYLVQTTIDDHKFLEHNISNHFAIDISTNRWNRLAGYLSEVQLTSQCFPISV